MYSLNQTYVTVYKIVKYLEVMEQFKEEKRKKHDGEEKRGMHI